jgi:DNA-binding CsgD family transcriptional regulator
MMHAKPHQTPKITPETLEFLEWHMGTGWVLRDEHFVAIWCNNTYARFGGFPREKIIGTRLSDFIGEQAAKDREHAYAVAINEHRPVSNIQFNGDDRMLSTVFPIDEESFGHKGVLCMIQETPKTYPIELDDVDTIIQSPVFTKLASLSTAELRVLYYLANGNTTQEISERLFRSTKTIENQISSIHKKIGTATRGELVKFASGRGIEKYTPDEWESIITAPSSIFPSHSEPQPGTNDPETK